MKYKQRIFTWQGTDNKGLLGGSFFFIPSLLPRFIDVLRSIDLALLQQAHSLPFRYIGRIHISAGLDAEPRAGTPGGISTHGRDVDVFSGVELESGFGAVHFEVQAGSGVVERSETSHRA